METLTLTKLQARQCLDYLEWAKDISSRFNQKELKNRKSWDNDLKELNGQIYFQKTQGDTCYRYLLENHTVTKITINKEEVTVPYLERLLGDLTPLEQRKALEDMYLTDIEKYLSKRCGIEIKLKSMVTNPKGVYQLKLYTDNLVEHTGICKAMLKNIYIESDFIGYHIDKSTGEQKLSYMRFNFRYTHQDGGHNGHEIGCVRFNEYTANFEGYNYETEMYEVI